MIVKSKDEILKIIEACKHVDSEMLESETVEFKEYVHLSAFFGNKELAEEISALANKNGGVVIIGIRDGNNVSNAQWHTQLVGFEVGDLIEIEQRIKGKLKPSLDIKSEYIEYENLFYLIIHVPTRRDTLIATSSGKICIRDGRSSRPMTPEEIKSAVNGLHNYDWTSDVLDTLSISDINEVSLKSAHIDYCTRKGYSPDSFPNYDSFLEAIGATSNGKLTKSGLLFLGKANVIKQWLGTYEYRFSWKTRSGSLLINDVWDDNLWETIARAKDHFKTCNTEKQMTFKNETYTFKTLDDIAFHEGFMNALVHRDYSIEGMVVVDFDSDQMIITNPGVFYGGISQENISVHQPRHRNKSLAKLLMNFQLVDRAGMGIRRMGLGSLMYGRQFPTFRESFDTVEVTMAAEFIIPGIFVLTRTNPEQFGIIDLMIFNSLYRKGSISIVELSKKIKGLVKDIWPAIKDSIDRHPQIELCGTKEGVYIRVSPAWNSFFDVRKTFQIPKTSKKHVQLVDYLMEFHKASNEDITNLLGHKTSTHTSQFLRDATYAKRRGNGPSARWSLTESVLI